MSKFTVCICCKAPRGQYPSHIPFIKLPLIKMDFTKRGEPETASSKSHAAFDCYVQNRVKSTVFSSFQIFTVFLLKLPGWQINSIMYNQSVFLWLYLKSMLLYYPVKQSVLELNHREIGGPRKTRLLCLARLHYFFLYINSLQGAYTWKELTSIESQESDQINRFRLCVFNVLHKKH